MDSDVSKTLGELERRLKELEQELESVGRSGEAGTEPAQADWTPPPPPPPGATPFTAVWSGGPQEAAPPPPPPPAFNGAPAVPVRPPYWQPADPAPVQQEAVPAPQAPAPAPEPAASAIATAGLHRQLDELLAFRERLVASTNDLVDELSRVLTDLGAEVEAAEEPAAPDPADTVLSGEVSVEAGPFHDLASLAAFEQALQQTDGVASVYVRALDQGRATIDVALEEPTRLAAALRARSLVGFDVAHVEDGRLVLEITRP